MKIGDLSTDALAHRQEGAYRLLQKGLIGNQLFHPMADDSTAGLADAQAQVLRAKPRIWFSRSRLTFTSWARLFRTALIS